MDEEARIQDALIRLIESGCELIPYVEDDDHYW
jgi:hypothetical protein